ncbi:vWA domain-containing protein [Sarcina ventriculi]|uniref:vWA domain-containing protein n=1 Tax=Sarcina ventriculi TaxID=1267 RepID=UPI0018A95BC6|nr:vWA domain-containing protein [Sarcina ventriculi]
MKNKNKKTVSLTVIMTLIITMIVGLINPVSIVKAEDTKSVRIKDVLNNDEIVSDDGKLILSKTGEKISDDELKVTLKIKGNNEENINIYNASATYTLNSGFELVENSINVVGIDDKESVKITTDGEKTNIEFGDINVKEVEVSFSAKVKEGIKVEENVEVTSETKLVYNLQENTEDNQENTEIDFPKLYVSLESIVAEKETTEENVENEIIEDITKKDEKTEENAKEDKEDIENEVADDTVQEDAIDDTNSEGTIDDAEENVDNDVVEDEVDDVVANGSVIKNENNENNSPTTSSGLTINKTAELVDGETVKITLTAEGEVTRTDAKNADIVMVIDKSGSMNDKLDKIKKAARNFVSNILSNTKDSDVRIAIVTYDYYGKYNGYNGQGSYLNLGFSSSKDDINKAINAITAGGGTNTQAGIRRAAETLRGDRTDAKKYVVFFTDGLPTQSYSGGNGTTVSQQYMNAAKDEYNKHFTSWNKTSSNNNQIDAKFYSVGVFTNASDKEKEQAVDFLKTIQNVIDPNEFGKKYYTQDLKVVNSIFTDISNEIAADINNTVATNVTINDIVTDYFNIVKDSWKVTDLKGNVINVQPEVTGNNITFKIGNISVSQGESKGGVIVTFNAKVKDAYFGGKNIDTNVSANITYNDGQKQEFDIPNVDIPSKKGTIKIKKEIVEKELLRGWNKVSDDEVNKDDKFSISVVGNEKYTVNLGGNSEETLNFYLKGENTDISINTDTSLNYLTVGQYKIEELLPMNYEQVDVYVETEGKTVKLENWENYNKQTKTFTIDKDNNNITIIVRNTLVNKGYWFDKTDVENKFRYYNAITPQQLETSIY